MKKIINKNSFLHEEPFFLLKQELKEPAVYFSVIETVARGATKYNEISTRVGVDCGFYVNSLIELHILRKETPIGGNKKSRKSIYILNDNLFRFWFKFLSMAVSLVEQELYDTVYDDVILPGLSQYIGYVFEQVCIQYLKRINGKKMLPFTFFDIGRWWGNNKTKKCQEEIDILAVDNKSNALFGECKWRNEPVDVPILQSLVEKSNLLPYSNKYYILFSKSGFTRDLLKSTENNKSIMCIDANDMELK